MEPIVLTEFGETLLAYPNGRATDEDETELSASASNCVGIHDICHGWVDFKPISEKFYVLRCRACGRITPPIPKEIDTFGGLRQWCAKKIAEKSAMEKIAVEPVLDGPLELSKEDLQAEIDEIIRDAREDCN